MTDALLGFLSWMLVGKVAAFAAAIYCMAWAAGHVLAWALDCDASDRASVDN